MKWKIETTMDFDNHTSTIEFHQNYYHIVINRNTKTWLYVKLNACNISYALHNWVYNAIHNLKLSYTSNDCNWNLSVCLWNTSFITLTTLPMYRKNELLVIISITRLSRKNDMPLMLNMYEMSTRRTCNLVDDIQSP